MRTSPSDAIIPLSVLGAASLAAWMSSAFGMQASNDNKTKGVGPRGTSLGQFLSDPKLLRRLSSSGNAHARVPLSLVQEETLSL